MWEGLTQLIRVVGEEGEIWRSNIWKDNWQLTGNKETAIYQLKKLSNINKKKSIPRHIKMKHQKDKDWEDRKRSQKAKNINTICFQESGSLSVDFST